MRKLLKVAAICLLPALLLTGCWSYRSLSDLTIVMGIGVDQDSETGGFRVSSEIADLSKPLKDTAPGSKVVVSEGKTLFDAIRNAKKRLLSRLYIGNIQVAVFSEELLRNTGITDILDWLMRDAEVRETVDLVVAQGCSAEKLFALMGTNQSISSLEMDKIITEDNAITSSTAYVELYQAYFMLNCPGISLALPAFHITDNDGIPTFEVNGMAVFCGDKLVGFISPEDSKFVLMATNKCKGGLLTLAQGSSGASDTALEIQNCETKTTYSMRDGQPMFRVDVEVNVFLGEVMADMDVLDGNQIKVLEEAAGKSLQQEIERVIHMVQNDLKSDIFGFGHKIYQRDVRLWEQLKPNWESIFPTIQVEVSCKVNIKNTAFIKSKEVISQ